jgi:hypothetical protein
MVIVSYIIYESLEGLSCYNIIGGVGILVSLRHNGLSMVRIRGSSPIAPDFLLAKCVAVSEDLNMGS